MILDAIIWKNKDMLPAVGSKDKPIPAGLRHPSLIYMEDKVHFLCKICKKSSLRIIIGVSHVACMDEC